MCIYAKFNSEGICTAVYKFGYPVDQSFYPDCELISDPDLQDIAPLLFKRENGVISKIDTK